MAQQVVQMLCRAAALRDTIRQYYIKLDDSQPIGGLPTAKNWVLRGPQNDTVGLHEVLAMKLSAGSRMWTPHTQYTEVMSPKAAIQRQCSLNTINLQCKK